VNSTRVSIVIAALTAALLLAACALYATVEPGEATPIPQTTPPPAEVWAELLQRTPFPYLTPLPAPSTTPLDGIYIKIDPDPATPTPCRRCPDYKPEGGLWKLQLDKGILRLVYHVTGWKSITSFSVSGDRLTVFNDPYCTEDVGTYTWKLEQGQLTVTAIQDECSIGLRAKNLTMFPWRACQPPNREAAITDHWPKPPGCDT
jgi:hypothetical protein